MKRNLLLSAALIVFFTLLTAGCADVGSSEATFEDESQTSEEFMSEEESSQTIALDFLLNSPTFEYDGLENTVRLLGSTVLEGETGCWQFEYEFQCANLGYGDRSGDSVAAIVTPHRTQIMVQDGELLQAMLDDVWDMLSQTRTKVRVAIQLPITEAEGVEELIRDLGGILRNSYCYSNGITITMDLPESAIDELSSDPRIGMVVPADKLVVVIELEPPLDEGIRELIQSLGGEIMNTYLSNEGIISAYMPEEAMEKLSSDPRIINVRPSGWGVLY